MPQKNPFKAFDKPFKPFAYPFKIHQHPFKVKWHLFNWFWHPFNYSFSRIQHLDLTIFLLQINFYFFLKAKKWNFEHFDQIFLTVILNKKCNYAQGNIYCFTHSGISPLGSTILRVSCMRLYFIILSADVVDVSEGEAFTCK